MIFKVNDNKNNSLLKMSLVLKQCLSQVNATDCLLDAMMQFSNKSGYLDIKKRFKELLDSGARVNMQEIQELESICKIDLGRVFCYSLSFKRHQKLKLI